ncbi:hypothetical protein ACLI4Y_07090 [Natrialbaceae archaeon A-CW3]
MSERRRQRTMIAFALERRIPSEAGTVFGRTQVADSIVLECWARRVVRDRAEGHELDALERPTERVRMSNRVPITSTSPANT